MFFIGVFGITSKRKEIGEIDLSQCKKCDGSKKALAIKEYSCFHIFFIPVIKWDVKYMVYCDSCQTLYSVSKEIGEGIESGSTKSVSYWSLEEVDNYGYDTVVVCKECNKSYNRDYEYCPYCGSKNSYK